MIVAAKNSPPDSSSSIPPAVREIPAAIKLLDCSIHIIYGDAFAN
jgi:hypothetical protein